MLNRMRSLIIGVAGASLLCTGAAIAQESNTIGPPQLRDFQIQPRERVVEQPRQGPPAPDGTAPRPNPVRVAPPPPAAQPAPPPPQAQPSAPSPQPTAQRPAQTPRQAPVTTPTALVPRGDPTQPAPTGVAPPQPEAAPPVAEPEPVPDAPTVTPPPEAQGPSIWLFGLPAALVVLLGLFWWSRCRARAAERREAAEEALAASEAAPAPTRSPERPRAEPAPRPWLDIDLNTTRASFTAAEAVIEFELKIVNTSKVSAENLRIDVKMFNAGAEQDQQIGSFYRTAGREQTRLNIPGIAAGQDGVIKGEVGLPIAEMKAVQLDGRALFIPVVAVNILYDWGDGRSGQSSKSYVVGRELEQPSDKMGAFRVDQGPRIWRAVGQREHSLTRRN